MAEVLVAAEQLPGADPASQVLHSGRYWLWPAWRLSSRTIFILSALYWGRVGVSKGMAILGLAMLTWGFSYAGYGSDLAFSTYFDVLFYVLGAWLILLHWLGWTGPVTALNREMSGLIPLMVVAGVMAPAVRSAGFNRRALRIVGGALGIHLLEYALPRLLLVPHVIVLLPAALLAVQISPGATADSKTVAG